MAQELCYKIKPASAREIEFEDFLSQQKIARARENSVKLSKISAPKFEEFLVLWCCTSRYRNCKSRSKTLDFVDRLPTNRLA